MPTQDDESSRPRHPVPDQKTTQKTSQVPEGKSSLYNHRVPTRDEVSQRRTVTVVQGVEDPWYSKRRKDLVFERLGTVTRILYVVNSLNPLTKYEWVGRETNRWVGG